MLHSTQASDRLLLESLVEGHYYELVRVAYSVLDDQEAAKSAVETTLIEIVQRRHRYQKHIDVRRYVFSRCMIVCRRLRPGVQLRKGLEALGSRGPGIVGLSPRDRVEAELWLAMESLSDQQRLPLLLHYLHGFSIQEIASLLAKSEPSIHSRIKNTESILSTVLESESGGAAEKDEILKSIERRWAVPDLSESELEEVKQSVFSRYEQVKRNQKSQSRLTQVALVSFSLVLVAVITWITNQTALRLTNPLAARTVLVTHIVKVPVYITPTPISKASQKHLTLRSAPSEVRQRMIENQETWETLWAETQVIQHGPSGYVGPPIVRREQLWLSKPADSLILSGPFGGAADHVWLAVDFRFYTLDQLDRPYEIDTRQSWIPGPANSSARIFNPNSLISGDHSLKIVGSSNTLGRHALIVDVLSEQGKLISSLWVDSQSGAILGLRSYDEDGFTVVEEIYLTKVEIDRIFPDTILNPDLRIRQFMEDYRALAADQNSEVEASPIALATGHEPVPQVQPPAGFDPSGSNLELQWSQYSPVETFEMTIVPVDIYAGGYFLGRVPIGNPWNAICERSPDGQSLAIVEQPDFPPFPSSRMRWINLSDLSDLNEPLPKGSRYGNDFAFSPDSRSLAFWGCSVRDDNCGVYILRLETGKLRKILPGRYAGYFIWSPDGNQLAMFRSDGFLMVVNVENGEIVYKNAIDWTDLVIPLDAPVKDWGSAFPPDQNGLQGCENPGI